MSTTAKQTNSTQRFNELVDEHRTEILIHKAIMNIACEIKAAREERGLSQRAVAKQAGLTQATVVRLEKGQTVNLETMMKVASIMGLQPKIDFEKL
jgi:DNA-binding XRE family transcriptional regulator